MFRKTLVLIFLLSFLSLPALAGSAITSTSNEAKNVEKLLQPNFLIGSATLKFLNMKVYDISLWSVSPQFSYQQKFAIQIRYNMNFSRQDLAKRSVEEIVRLHDLSDEKRAEYQQKFSEIFSDVKKGDEKIALFDPKKGVELYHNSHLNGTITNLELARLFVDIWLDRRGSYPKVTNQLFGNQN